MKNLRFRRQRKEKKQNFMDNGNEGGGKGVMEQVIIIHEEETLKKMDIHSVSISESEATEKSLTCETSGFLTGDDRVFDAGMVLAEYCRKHLEPYMEWLGSVYDEDLEATDVCDLDLKSLSADDSVDSGVSVSPFENICTNAPEETSDNLGVSHDKEGDKDMDDEPINVAKGRRAKKYVIESDTSDSDVELLDEILDSQKAEKVCQPLSGQKSQSLESKPVEDSASTMFTREVRRSKRRLSEVHSESRDSDPAAEESSSDDVQILKVKVFSEVSETEKPKLRKRAISAKRCPSSPPVVPRKRSLRNIKKSSSLAIRDDDDDEGEVKIVSVNLYRRSSRMSRKSSTSQDEITLKKTSTDSGANTRSLTRTRKKRVTRSCYSLRSRSTRSQV